MLTNEIYELLKTKRAFAVGLIKSRQPQDVQAAIRGLYVQLDKAANAAKAVDFGETLPESVTFPISELRAQAEAVAGDVCSNRDALFVEKNIKPEEFAAYVAAEVEKAYASAPADARSIGFSLVKRIDKAIAPFAALPGQAAPLPKEMAEFVFCKEDAAEAAETRKAAADAVAKGEKAPAPGPWTVVVEGAIAKSAAEVKASVTESVAKTRALIEKASNTIEVPGGWGLDLNTRRFLHGEAFAVDFGADPKPKQ